MEVLKLVATLLGGGLAGAVLTQWLQRRQSKLQKIPLIERVNRTVTPGLKGYTLARIRENRLEPVLNVREYQLSLRNTSTVHLQNVEIQFEFPEEDVEAWAERPTLSKTTPEVVEAIAAPPWKKAFRWRIPSLPSGDSMEFTFRAVDPPSNNYEVALYKIDRVVVEKTQVEPLPYSRVEAAAIALWRYHR